MSAAFWPYEEVQFSIVQLGRGQFSLKTPWITSTFEVAPGSAECEALVQWIAHQENADPKYLPGLWKVLAGLQSLPIAYELPRRETKFGTDSHKTKKTFPAKTPRAFAKEIGLPFAVAFAEEWTWDIDSIKDFTECEDGKCDPLSVLSVARRFHYLDDSDNKMNSIYDYIKTIKDDKQRKLAAAIVVRQNHYVTEKCLMSLQPAVDIAQSQKKLVEQFMQEEKGHDAILGSGIKAMNVKLAELPLTEGVQNLMQLLEKSAFYNFLAFCMALDFFEKPQFKDQDSLSAVLTKLGEATAARALQAHKNINDHGEHEGFSRQLLLNMTAVDTPYLVQALQFAELVSKSIIQVSHDLEKIVMK